MQRRTGDLIKQSMSLAVFFIAGIYVSQFVFKEHEPCPRYPEPDRVITTLDYQCWQWEIKSDFVGASDVIGLCSNGFRFYDSTGLKLQVRVDDYE